MSEFPVITRYEVVGAQDVIRTNAELWNSFRQGEMNVKEFSTSLKENMEGTYAMRRAYSGMRMAIRVSWAPLLETAQALNDVGRIGRDVVQMWQAYTMGQLRIERAMRDVADAQQEVAKWQSLYNQYLRDFGADSAITKDASENLIDAYKRLKETQEAATKAQSDMVFGFVGMGLEATGIIGTLVSLAYHVKVLKATLAAAGIESAGFATSLGGIGAAATTALPPVLLLMGAIAANKLIEEQKEAWKSQFPKEVQKGMILPKGMIEGQKEAQDTIFNALKNLIGGIPHGQLGIDYIPENMLIYAHKGEKLLNPEQTRRERIVTGNRPIQANVTQYNTITREADADAAADRAYQKLLKKLGAKI